MPSLTILCIDDEPSVLLTLSLVLRHHGHTVLTATSAAEALARVSSSTVDVVLIDHSICDNERICLNEHLRARQPGIKMILHTGNPSVTECLGRVPVLAKPVDPREIAQKIEKILTGGDGDSGPPE